MLRAAAVLLALVAIAAGGCSKKPAAKTPEPAVAAPEPPDTRPRLTLDVEPADAEILVDDEVVGTAGSLSSLPLDPGTHRIVVRKPGYDTWRAEVILENGDESLRVQLEPEE